MSASTHVDIIVVGAGPAGSTCASLLSERGLNVLLLDKANFPRDKICGDCINPRAWQYFDLLGVSEMLRTQHLQSLKSVRVANVAGENFVVALDPPSSTPFFSLRRSVLDSILLDRAGRKGATILQETRVVDITPATPWNVSVRNRQGSTRFTCDVLVGADGRNSAVAHMVGARTIGQYGSDSQKRVGFQWHARFQPSLRSEVQLFTLGNGYLGVVNVDDQTSNIALVADKALGQMVRSDFPGFLQGAAHNNPLLRQMGLELMPRGNLLSAFPVDPVRREWHQSRLFLIGDAHQTVEPFTGEGIAFALEDGYRAACRILATYHKRIPYEIGGSGKFFVNQVVSPALRNTRIVESFVSLASRFSWLAQLFANRVLRVPS